MRLSVYATIVAVVGSILFAAPAAAQVDPIAVELDAFWAEASRTVAEGDHEAMVAMFHPDGVHVGGTPDGYRTRLFSANREQLAAESAETRSGARSPGIEFRFSSRVHDENTAHEVGIYHFWMTRPGEPRRDSYGVVDAYLVKKDGRWMFLVSIQRELSTKEAWDALGGDH